MADYTVLEKTYKQNQKEIDAMLNSNTNYISKVMFRRAYYYSPVEDESEVNALTQITSGDSVFYNDSFYDVKYADNNLGIAKLDTDEVKGLVSIEKLEREVTPPSMCMGHILALDEMLTEYVLENLEEVSRIGYEIYEVDEEEHLILLGVPSVASNATVEYHTPLYFAWKNWNDKKFQELKSEVKSYGVWLYL